MVSEKELLSKLDELQKACTDFTKEVGPLFEPVIKVINEYFKPGDAILTHDVQYTINQLILDMTNRFTVYEHSEFLPVLPKNFPTGYDDIRKVFTANGALDEIQSIGATTFNRGYTYTGTGEQQTPVSNRYLTTWQRQVSNARASELSALSLIASFCESGSYNTGLAMAFEDLGSVVSSMSRTEMAKRIYITGGYKEIIERFELNVHIPSSVKGL